MPGVGGIAEAGVRGEVFVEDFAEDKLDRVLTLEFFEGVVELGESKRATRSFRVLPGPRGG